MVNGYNNVIDTNKKNLTFMVPPSSLVTAELEGLYGESVLSEMYEIIKYYDIYERGADFATEGSGDDYIPADLKYKQCKTLIDKEARFLFSKRPDFIVNVRPGKDEAETKKRKEQNTILQNLVDEVLKKNQVAADLVKAAKDCFIAKRVAIILNFNEDGIGIRFAPALEFVYDVDTKDTKKITKLAAFFIVNDNIDRSKQRIYKKKYYMNDRGYCVVQEGIYDGSGNLKEVIIDNMETKFTYIPAVVILNGGLTGDLQGESEIFELKDCESWYSRMSNGDIDSLRQNMNPIRYTVDASPDSTKNLPINAGAYWDLQTDQNLAENSGSAKVGVLNTEVAYSTALDTTLKRIQKMENSLVDMPSIETEQEKLTSGKALKAIYWPLIVRCDEKMMAWRPALTFMVETIIEGAKLYPMSAKKYVKEPIPDVEYSVEVDNQYPFPQDEIEEKTIDVAEVESKLMSKKAYMKKWRHLTDEEVTEELKQIALEREIIDDSFNLPKDNPVDLTPVKEIAEL